MSNSVNTVKTFDGGVGGKVSITTDYAKSLGSLSDAQIKELDKNDDSNVKSIFDEATKTYKKEVVHEEDGIIACNSEQLSRWADKEREAGNSQSVEAYNTVNEVIASHFKDGTEYLNGNKTNNTGTVDLDGVNLNYNQIKGIVIDGTKENSHTAVTLNTGLMAEWDGKINEKYNASVTSGFTNPTNDTTKEDGDDKLEFQKGSDGKILKDYTSTKSRVKNVGTDNNFRVSVTDENIADGTTNKWHENDKLYVEADNGKGIDVTLGDGKIDQIYTTISKKDSENTTIQVEDADWAQYLLKHSGKNTTAEAALKRGLTN